MLGWLRNPLSVMPTAPGIRNVVRHPGRNPAETFWVELTVTLWARKHLEASRRPVLPPGSVLLGCFPPPASSPAEPISGKIWDHIGTLFALFKEKAGKETTMEVKSDWAIPRSQVPPPSTWGWCPSFSGLISPRFRQELGPAWFSESEKNLAANHSVSHRPRRWPSFSVRCCSAPAPSRLWGGGEKGPPTLDAVLQPHSELMGETGQAHRGVIQTKKTRSGLLLPLGTPG